MPRSFLLKKYYPRNDDSHIYSFLDLGSCMSQSFKEISISDMQFFSPTDKLKWDYEYEKSYWFDTSGVSSGVQGNNKETSKTEPKQKYANKERTTEIPTTSDLESSSRSQTTVNNIKSFIATMIQPGGISPAAQDSKLMANSPVVLKTTVNLPGGIVKEESSEEKDPEILLNDQLELQISEMIEEDDAVIVQKIREFLENNAIVPDDVGNEIGVHAENLRSFLEMQGDLTTVEKQDLCRWYLEKLFRGPSSKKPSEESYTCKKCGKIFTYKSYLERHIKYVCPDSTGRSWKCNYCGKAFQYPCYLRRHVRSHTGESPYKCDKCDRAFVRSTDLQRHIRNHTGEKPYRCTQCSRAFARSTDLKRHMRTHTGEKPYKCWKCGKSFSQSGSLQTHLHTHSKEQVLAVKSAGKKKL